jgi:hypothetical protein
MSTERRPLGWIALLAAAVVTGAWTTAGLRYHALWVDTQELRATHAQHVQSDRRWQRYLRDTEAEIKGLQVAIADLSDGIDGIDADPPGRYIAVSLNERWLELRDDTEVIWHAPVAIGRGWADDVTKERGFSTPRGRREIQGKVKNPVWIPPDWHYREVAYSKKVRRVSLERGSSVALSDGSRVEVRGRNVGRVDPEGKFTPYSGGRDVVVDGKVIQPPFGTRQRRKGRVMGSRKLALGKGYAIHGTNKNWSIGRAASHGCLRMMNKDIEELYAMVDVGTPVFIY